MHNSICENLIETGEAEEHYFIADEEDIDELDSISLLNVILSGTARLNVLLPATTVLIFTIFSPFITKDGKCSSLNQWLMGLFLALLAASCILFAFTDSFRTATGRLYYGVATFNGIWTFCGRKRPCVPTDYRLRWSDLFHSSLSLLAFLTFAASHSDVLSCYDLNLPRKVTNSVPIVVGFVISVLFILFPSRRKGIGYPFLLQSDDFYSKN